MYYKAMAGDRVVDVLDKLVFLRYQPKNKIMVLCDESDAQAILSSDKKKIWHESTLYNIPVRGYDTVTLVEIDKFEYEQLRVLNYKTPQEIIDAYTLSLINEGVIK